MVLATSCDYSSLCDLQTNFYLGAPTLCLCYLLAINENISLLLVRDIPWYPWLKTCKLRLKKPETYHRNPHDQLVQLKSSHGKLWLNPMKNPWVFPESV
jgi:hypothetical protein